MKDMGDYPSIRVVVFKTQLSTISVLLVAEAGVPGENHWPAASHWRETIQRYT